MTRKRKSATSPSRGDEQTLRPQRQVAEGKVFLPNAKGPRAGKTRRARGNRRGGGRFVQPASKRALKTYRRENGADQEKRVI